MPVRFALLLTVLILLAFSLNAKDHFLEPDITLDVLMITDSLPLADTVIFSETSFIKLPDSLPSDTLLADTTNQKKTTRNSGLEDKVLYSAEDSMMISVTGEKLYLYGKAKVKYMNIDLEADYIMLDLKHKEVFAKGLADSAGNVTGPPVFKQGSESFESDSMRYNFDTEKGIIYNIISQQGEGYFHSNKTKRLENGHIHAVGNKYTTCDEKHPHFYLSMNKAIVIPEDKIITGFAHMVVEDVPLPLVIPFGYFPNTTNRSSGILFPTYGDGGSRGFYLRDFGWYQVMGEYMDLTFQGDIYSKGSWGFRTRAKYNYRYHYSGDFGYSYNLNTNNDDIDPTIMKDYAVTWSHRQDAKANPTQNFSASVNFRSSKFDALNSYNTNDYLNGARSSNISYSKGWSGANLSLSANAVQTTQTKQVDANLPTGSFNMETIYPFRRSSGSDKYKFWENISLGYRSDFNNEINTYDSALFRQETLDNMNTGFKHSIPLSVNFKLGKMITLTPSLNYSGMIYTKYINKTVVFDSNPEEPGDSLILYYDTIPKTTYIQGFSPSISLSFTPKMYGMYVSRKENSYFMAIRHVMSPSASFSFTPDMRNVNPNYYDSLFYNKNNERVFYEVYSKYQKEMYGVPSSYGKSGSVRLALNNNFEMKVRPRNDTTGESKKVSLLDNLNFSTGYNPFAEKFKWSDVSMVSGTRLFKNKMDIRVNGSFSPYALDDSTGTKIDVFYWNTRKKLLRFTGISVSSGISFSSKQGSNKDDNSSENQPEQSGPLSEDFGRNEIDFVPGESAGQYVNFDVPWSVKLGYSWSYNKTGLTSNVQHTVNFNGDFSLTPRWKIGYNSGYDIEAKKVTFTNFNIYRDLHCWEMVFTVVPFGKRASYSFTIRAKSSLLNDLKYEKKPNNWYDNF